MKKQIVIFLILLSAILTGCVDKKAIYDEAYQDGYSAGYNDASVKCEVKLQETRSSAYKDGFNDGKYQGTLDLLNSLRKDGTITKEDWMYITGASVYLETDLDHAELFAVNSTAFSAVGYIETYDLLWVTFKESQKTYVYFDFPESEYDSFKSAESLGKHFNESIKGNYDYLKWN